MDTFFEQVYTLLTVPPGNLAYHLVLAFSIAAAFQGALFELRRPAGLAGNRLVAGLLLLLSGQLVLFAAGGVAWQGLADPHILLPPLDRAMAVASLVVIFWLWAFPLPAAWQDALCGFLILGAAVCLGLSLNYWAQYAQPLPFNGTWLAWAWDLAALVVSLAGILVLVLRRPPAWGFAVGIFGVFLLGTTAQLLVPQTAGDFAGPVRLAQLAAYPLLLALPHRVRLADTAGLIGGTSESVRPGINPQVGADPRMLEALLVLASTPRNTAVSAAAVTRAAALVTHADRCFLVGLSSPENSLEFQPGYDSSAAASLPAFSLDTSPVHSLTQVIKAGVSARLDRCSTETDEWKGLAQVLGLPGLGSLFAAPIGASGQSPARAILLVSLSPEREWTAGDQDSCTLLAAWLAGVSESMEEPAPSREVAKVSSEASSAWQQEELQAAPDSSAQPETRADYLPVNPAEEAQKDLFAVMAVQEELHGAITRLQEENEKLKAAAVQANRQLGVKTSHLIQRESVLQDALAEIERLRNRLAQLEADAGDAKPQESQAQGS